ncbi:MAG: NUDIX domain-containing protein [Pseudomonadota bacterium]
MFSKKDVETLNSDRLFRGFLSVTSVRLKHALFARQGDPYQSDEVSSEVVREVVNNRAAVGVLLVDKTLRQVALVEQFRIGPYVAGDENPWLLELVAGLVEAGESPAEVAVREALEEANCQIMSLEHINDYYSSPGGGTQLFSLFCGWCDLSQAGGVYGLAKEQEDILVHTVGFDECFDMLTQKQISNAHTMIAIQWLKMNHA